MIFSAEEGMNVEENSSADNHSKRPTYYKRRTK